MENEEILTPIIEELTRVLEGNATREEIETEVVRYYTTYDIKDPEKIKKTIISKKTDRRAADMFTTANHVVKKIADLTGSETAVDIIVKIVYAEKKKVSIRGSMSTIISGTVGDETGTAQFTVWNGDDCTVEKDAVYRLRNAYCKLWNDKVQINIGSKGTLVREDADISVSGNIAPRAQSSSVSKKIGELAGNEGNIDIEAKAVFAAKKDVIIRGENRTIISGTIGDETGTAQFTVWDGATYEIETGKCYSFKNAYAKTYNDQVQVNIGNSGSVEPSGKDIQCANAPAPKTLTPGEKKKIGALAGNERNVDIAVKALFAEVRDITIKGEPRSIISGLIGDETGTAQFTVWDASSAEVEKGRSYIFKNAYIKTYNDKIQVNIGNSGSVEPSEEDVQVQDRPQQASFAAKEIKICDIRDGLGSITVSGKILSMETRKIISQGEEKTVWSGLIADETGKIQFSSWNEPDVRAGDSVRVANGYVRSWKGIPQLNIGERAAVTKIEDSFGDISATAASEKTVGDIVKNGGGIDISVTGTVVDLREGSGIIRRCPECNRSMLGTDCMKHGAVEPVLDLRMKIVIDDSTGAMSAIVNRDITEKLTGITLADAKQIAEMKGETDCIAKMLAEKILFRRVNFCGNVMTDEYGPSMIVRSADIAPADVKDGAKKLLDRVQEAIQ